MAVYLRTRNLANNRLRYFLDIYHNGQRHYEFLFIVEKDDDKKEKKALAELIRSKKAIELEAEGTDFTPKFLKNIEVIIYFERFLADYKKQDKRIINGSINKLKEFFIKNNIKSNLVFKQLTERHFKEFADFLNYDSDLTGETPHNYWKKFKLIINQAKREKLINSSVFENVKFRKRTQYSDTTIKKKVLTEEEIKVLWETECGNAEVKKSFLYSCYTGLGLAEVRDLKWGSMVNNTLYTSRKKTGREINNALSAKIIQSLGETQDKNSLVFDLKNKITGKYLTTNSINKVLTSWMKKANIDKHITFYSGRHTFAVRLLNKGTNLKTVADAMGHSNTTITAKYLNYINELKDKATAGLE